MDVKIKLLSDRAIIPVQKPGDSGSDLYATHDVTVHCGRRDKVRFGLAFEIPEGYGGFIFPRSGLANVGRIVHTGVIDCSYRGEVCATVENLSGGDWWTIKRGDRIAQIVIMAVPRITYDVCSELSETERQFKGFGSSGR